jgi:RHS repeat-associated protein
MKRLQIFSDHIGSPKFVIDTETGAVAQQMEYDEFGAVLSDSNSGFQPFGFAGGLYDADTKLVRIGARDYDSETARSITKDPLLAGTMLSPTPTLSPILTSALAPTTDTHIVTPAAIAATVFASPSGNPYVHIGDGRFLEPYSQRISVGDTPGKKAGISISQSGRIEVRFGPLGTSIRPDANNSCGGD